MLSLKAFEANGRQLQEGRIWSADRKSTGCDNKICRSSIERKFCNVERGRALAC
jgi:hypothetical protein